LKVSDEVMSLLNQHDWTGNVRELENTLMQAVVLTNGDVLLKEHILLKNQFSDSSSFPINLTLTELEKKHIISVLEFAKWSKPKAAEMLGISLPTLYSKIENYKLAKSE
ncbi:MAG: helix-turn-helix domain-containing protein, partial [Bacteroidota bacterium]